MEYVKYRILVVDFNSQYTQLLLRRIRELKVYSESCSYHDITENYIHEFSPNGIVLSGGPYSVIDEHSPKIPKFIFYLGIPILGICYGMQLMAIQMGGRVLRVLEQREFGCVEMMIIDKNFLVDGIYDYIDKMTGNMILDVWMSHGEAVTSVPDGFKIVGVNKNKHFQIAMMVDEKSKLYGIQFHPEVTHTKKGRDILKRFVIDICACKASWETKNIIDNIITNIRKLVGDDKLVLAFSGGIDSFVTALLLQRAIGHKFICIFINSGLLSDDLICRMNNFYKNSNYDLNIIYVSEEQRFLDALVGVIDPEKKRKIIGKIFIEVFEEQIHNLSNVKWLAQGTIYSDVIESGIMGNSSSRNNVIKSHHNVGGIPEIMSFKLLEPIKNLFKDEVRTIGLNLGVPINMINRYPFPGPGLAIRIVGEVKKLYCDILRKVDFIFYEELKQQNLYFKISQAFSVFLPVHSVGVQGDQRVYKWVIVLRAVETVDFMTASWVDLPYSFLNRVSNRIVNEVEGISRVVYDISCKPPATIEWE